MQLYYQTQYRYSAYAAGVIVGVVVNKSDVPVSETANAGGAFATWAMLVVSLAVVAFVIVTGGGDADLEAMMYRGAAYLTQTQKMDCLWYRLQVALQRPLLDLAAACLTWLCVSGRAPRLARCLGAKAWRPLAALSYSCYLVQFIAINLVGKPLHRIVGLDNTTSQMGRFVILLIGPLVHFIFTLPFGFVLYSLVERPGILLGKHAISAMFVAVKPRDDLRERTPDEIQGTGDDIESQGSTADTQTPSQDGNAAHEVCQTKRQDITSTQ